MNKISKNVPLFLGAYIIIGSVIAFLEFNNIRLLQIPLRLISNFLLIFFLLLSVEKGKVLNIQNFIKSIGFYAGGGLFFIYTDSSINILFGIIFFMISKYYLFNQFQNDCNIRNVGYLKLFLVMIPSFFSLLYCSKYMINFIPDEILAFCIIILFIDALLLGLSFFYSQEGVLKIWFIIGLLFTYIGDLYVGHNLFYGHLIGEKLPGIFFSQVSKVILTLVVYYQMKGLISNEEKH